MVEDGVDVAREDGLVVRAHGDGGVGPPQEGLRQGRGVVEHALNLEHGAPGAQREAGHALEVEHALALAHPDDGAAVGPALNGVVHGQERAGPVVLRPVELDAARYPRARQPDEGGLDDVVVVDEVALLQLVVGHLDAPAQLGEYHDLQVFVLEEHGAVRAVVALVLDLLDDGVGVDHAAAALVDALLEEHRVAVGTACAVGGEDDVLFPCFYCFFHTLDRGDYGG